jgi:hypothetical protein
MTGFGTVLSRLLFKGIVIAVIALSSGVLVPRNGAAATSASASASLHVVVKDAGSGERVPCRVHLEVGGKPFYAPGLPAWAADRDFCCDGGFDADVPAGRAQLAVERGPEWLAHSEEFEIEAGSSRTVEVKLSRWIDMNARGWYSGDLHVHRAPQDMPLLVAAEDLNVAPDLTVWNQRVVPVREPYLLDVAERGPEAKRPRFVQLMNQEDERFGGALLFFNLKRPVPTRDANYYAPPGLAYMREALEQGAHVEQEKPFWWEAPVNVALGRVQSMGIVHNHFQRQRVMDNEAWGRARDPNQYPGMRGFCLYSLDLYYRYLNMGWEIPASAGSASGVLANPVGYCRAYVKLDRFDYEGWFEAFRRGRSFVTNGPMLFATVNGEPPGAHLKGEPDQPLKAVVRVEALSRAPLEAVEIIVGGKVAETLRPEGDDAKRIAGERTLALDRSTWIAVRAFEAHKPTVRFAHTSPFYIDAPGSRREDRDAAAFYVKWIDDLIAEAQKNREKYGVGFDEVVRTYKQAREVYEGKAKSF